MGGVGTDNTPRSTFLSLGRARSNYGGVAEILCLLLAHVQRHW